MATDDYWIDTGRPDTYLKANLDLIDGTRSPRGKGKSNGSLHHIHPQELLAQTLEIERQLGRERTTNRNGPRTLDIDLLFYDKGAWVSPTVTLPHPRWSSRGFVVIPLSNLLQDPVLAKHPAWGSLAAEVRALPVGDHGLRPWQGPTPWSKTP